MKEATPRTPEWEEALNAFSENIRADIDSIWDNHGVLPAETVSRIVGTSQIETDALMMQLLPVAQQYAVVPVSHYRVGAVAAGMPIAGTNACSLYLGANFEFCNAALNFTAHAEQAATNNAWLSGEHGVQMLAINAAPCGYCRQFLYELVTAEELKILLPDPNNPVGYAATPLTNLLPNAFGPGDLGVKGGFMDPALSSHALELITGSPADPLIDAALKAASASYAPYATDKSFNYAGVAVQLADGKIYAGRHAENAAYNPSLSPLESALAFMNMGQPLSATRTVNRCVLVEVATLASQRSATQAALAAYAAGVQLEYHMARIVSG
ncbi:MAG: cytidine deaminase [Verrucomicrobiota bacterium]|jgi:cytidine deaminase